MEEENDNDTALVNKLDINDINAILEVLKTGTEKAKHLLTLKVAKKITSYKIKDVIAMLQATTGTPHRNLVNGITKNITCYEAEQIAQILIADSHNETHKLIAWALNKNYTYFTTHTFDSFQLPTSKERFDQYAHAIAALNEKYRDIAIEPLASELGTYNDSQINKILESSHEQSKVIIITAIAQIITESDEYDFSDVIKASNEQQQEILAIAVATNINNIAQDAVKNVFNAFNNKNKEIVITAMAKNITHIQFGHLTSILATSHEQGKAIVAHAIAKNINTYSCYSLDVLLKYFNKQNKAIIASAITQNIESNINKYNESVLFEIFDAANEQEKIIIAKAFAQTVTHGDESNLYSILKVHAEQTQKILIAALLKEYNYAEGSIIACIRDHIKKAHQIAYEQISKEFELTENDWIDIKKEFNKQTACFVKANNPAEQCDYTVHIDNRVKELIHLVCKERNITEKIVIEEFSDERHTLAYVKHKKMENNKYVHILALNPNFLQEASDEKIRITLEHELGGHVRYHHTTLHNIILDHILDKQFKLSETSTAEMKGSDWIEHMKIKTEKLSARGNLLIKFKTSASYVALKNAAEYEADLSSAIDDLTVANIIKHDILQNPYAARGELYMTHQQFHKEIMAIIHLKEAEQRWYSTYKHYDGLHID